MTKGWAVKIAPIVALVAYAIASSPVAGPALPGRFALPPRNLSVAEDDFAAGQRSGGRAVAHHAGGIRARGVPKQKMPIAEIHSIGITAAEPTVGLDRQGAIFVVGIESTATSLQWPVVRSTNRGQTWNEVSPRLVGQRRHVTGQDPFLYVDKVTGRVFTADLLGYPGCTPVSFSDNRGRSWDTGQVCDLSDHQNIFTGSPPEDGAQPSRYPNVVYYCAVDAGGSVVSGATSCAKSLDGGATFLRTGEPAFVSDPSFGPGIGGVPGACAGATGHGFVGPDGTVYLPRGMCEQPWLAISTDEGLTWERVQVAGNGMPVGPAGNGGPGIVDHEAAVAADGKGTVYYAWVARDRLPYLAVSRDGGTKWSKPMMIGPPGLTEASLPALDIGDDGKIAIAYVGSTNAPGGKSPSGEGPGYADATWNGYITVTTDARARRPLFFTTSINHPRDPLVRGDCPVLRCQQQFDFIDVQVGPDGTPWASMVDGCPPRGECVGFGIGVVGHLRDIDLGRGRY